MRILHISTRLILGGSQENTVLSCEGQARLGHEVHLAFGPIYGPEGSLLERVEKFRTAEGKEITTHVVPHLVREVRPIADRQAFGELYRLVKTLQPDVVHTHSSKAGILARGAAWRVVPRPAIVHTIHGPPFMPLDCSLMQRANVGLEHVPWRRSVVGPRGRGDESRFPPAEAGGNDRAPKRRKPNPRCKPIEIGLANWMYERAERYAANRCHTIISVADAMTREFLARGIGRPEQYVTVRSGMEVEPFLHAAPGEGRDEVRGGLGLAADDFVVGTVARLAEHKGHDDLLDALGPEMKGDPRIKMLWVGDGWWRSRLIERARGLGLGVTEVDRPASAVGSRPASSRQVFVTGLVPPGRIPGLIRAMDVLAHPSYREGLPRTVPQALLSGVCPIAYDCDGTGEVCREMETGRLVPTGDRDGLREAILWAMRHPTERMAMATRGREECRVSFSAETMVAELEKVYARAIEIAKK